MRALLRPPRRCARMLLLLAACAICGRAGAVVTDATIMRIEAELRGCTNPDSLRLELAVAYRTLGSPEGRLRALALIDEIRPVFARDPRFLREDCLTLEACHRFDLACEAAERLLAIAPEEIEIRLVCARAAVRAMIRYDDAAFLDQALRELDLVLERKPDQPEALWTKSFLFAYWALRDPAQASRVHREGLAWAAKLLERSPQDVPAWLLAGVHRLGLGEMEQAETCFRRAIAFMDSTERAAFLRAPEDEPSADGWRGFDPLPFSVVNEGQLEYWSRLALADALFGGGEPRVPGWETDPGRVLVLYGPPETKSFEPAYLGGGDATYAKYSPRLRDRRNYQDTRMPAEMPVLTWEWLVGERRMRMDFRDMTLDGTYRATPQTRMVLAEIDSTSSVAFIPSVPERACTVHLAGASFAANAKESRLVLTLGFEPAGLAPADLEARDLAVRYRLLDAAGMPVGADTWKITWEHLCGALRGVVFAQTTAEYLLPPGDYDLQASLGSGTRRSIATFGFPVSVADYSSQDLRVSDIELLESASSECPAVAVDRVGRPWVPCVVALAGDRRDLYAYFEIYHLAVDPQSGRKRFQMRYTLLPRACVTALDSRPAPSGAPPRMKTEQEAPAVLSFGKPGARVDEVTLTARNCVDVLFPEEEAPGNFDAAVPKAAGLPLAGVDAGAYVFFVTVHDPVSGATSTARAAIAVLTDEEIAAESATGQSQR